MRNVLDKRCRESHNTHFMFNKFFFFSRKSHRLWDNVEKCGVDWGETNGVTIWRIRVACWISIATCTYAHAHACTHRPIRNAYCFPAVNMNRESASVLRYTYIICIVSIIEVSSTLINTQIRFTNSTLSVLLVLLKWVQHWLTPRYVSQTAHYLYC